MLGRDPVSFSGTYDANDVTFLLKPSAIPGVEVEEKERLIQSGARHYSEMLSPETVPDQRYMDLYSEALGRNAPRLRSDVEAIARAIAARPETSRKCVIISLARAGTPIGVLLKRALPRLGVAAHHYSISIIRGRGIDTNALRFIHERHGSASAIFVDGWTGKGTIKGELERSLASDVLGFKPFLAVVADPAGRADLAATTEDYVIPSGLLNGIVSGLVSRSVLTDALVGPDDFHACLFQEQHLAHDISQAFIAEIEGAGMYTGTSPGWTAESATAARIKSEQLMHDLMAQCGLSDINRIKPGIAEATRAILRRVPDRVYVADLDDPEVRHMRHLAAQSGVPVIERHLSNYRAVTIIKSVGGDQE
jgi:hypothetical protein